MDLTAQIAQGHGYLGYIVAAAVLGSIARAVLARQRDEEYSSGAARLAGLLVALQFVYGLLVYVLGAYWDGSGLLFNLHPLVMLGATATAGIATARAGREDTADGAWGQIVTMHSITAALIVVGIGLAATG